MKMKRAVLSGFLVFMVLGAGAQKKVQWYSIEEALALTSREPRVLVIDVYTDWCGWCKRMDAATFSHPEVAEILNRDFYPVKLNAEGRNDIVLGDRTYKFVDNGRRGYHELAAIVTRGRLSYPTVSYVGPRGRVLLVAPGYVEPEQFKVFLAYFNGDAYQKYPFEVFRDSVYTEPRSARMQPGF